MLINSLGGRNFPITDQFLLVGWEFYEQCRYIDKPRKLTFGFGRGKLIREKDRQQEDNDKCMCSYVELEKEKV